MSNASTTAKTYITFAELVNVSAVATATSTSVAGLVAHCPSINMESQESIFLNLRFMILAPFVDICSLFLFLFRR